MWIAEYAAEHDLPYEKGAELGLSGPFGAPMKRFARRVQNHMHAVNLEALREGKFQPYPGVRRDGTLHPAFREALRPKRPSWQDELIRIVHQDAKNPNAAYYTQGPARWQGVRVVYGDVQPEPEKWDRMLSGDCSAGVSRWHLGAWQSHLGRVPGDFVNHCRWQAGFTGTIVDACTRVRGKIEIGDLPVYFKNGKSHHVEVVIDPAKKLCGNHGGQSGPNIVPWALHETPLGFWRPNYADA